MRRVQLYIILILGISCFFLASCSEDYPDVYEGKPFFEFPTDDLSYNIYVQQHFQNFYFYDEPNRTRDTVYIPLAAVAAIPDKDVRLSFEAFDSDTLTFPERIESSTVNAIPGIHYVPFDSGEMKNLLVFHSGQMRDTIPVIVLRDKTLKTNTYRLTFRLTNTSETQVADGEDNRVVVYMADRVSKPRNWNAYYFGSYGDVKLDFMIHHSDLKWNYDDMEMVLNDSFLLSYYVFRFKADLKDLNELLGDEGPLRESDGTVVTFDMY